MCSLSLEKKWKASNDSASLRRLHTRTHFVSGAWQRVPYLGSYQLTRQLDEIAFSMGCSSSKQVQVQSSDKPEYKPEGKPVRGDLYVAWISGPSRATLMTCAALGIRPNLKPLDLFKGETRTPEFIAINPFHTVPTYVDGDFKIWESRAIMPYLVTTFGGPDHQLYPRDPQKRALVDNVLNTDQSTIDKAVSGWALPQFTGKTDGVDMNEKLEAVKKAMTMLNDFYLTKNSYVAGPNLTIADFSILVSVLFLELFNLDLSEFPKVVEWFNRMKKLPYFEKCNKVILERMKQKAEEQQQN